MPRLLHGGLYRETLRSLRVPALALIVLSAVLSLWPLLFDVTLSQTAHRFGDVCYGLLYLPFVAPPLFTLIVLRYQFKRAGSDLYFGLPLSKSALLLTRLAAGITWTALATVSTALVGAVCALCVSAPLDMTDVLLESGGSLVASLFVTAITALACQLCGTALNALFTAAMLLLSPRLIAYTAVAAVTAASPFLTPDSGRRMVDLVSQNLLYGGCEQWSVWIATVLKLMAVAALTLWLCKRRPSEAAGHPTFHPVLHVILRTLVGVLFSLPALTCLLPYRPYLLAEGILFYVLGLAAYYVYELILTRSAKGLLRATVWLPLLIVVNLLLFVGCQWLSDAINQTELTADTVDSVSVTRIVYRESDSVFERGYGYDAALDHEAFTTDTFYSLTRRYVKESDAAEVRLTDERSIAIACEALARQPIAVYIDYPMGDTLHLYALPDPPTIAFLADIEYRQGLFTHTRRVAFTDTELRRLLSRVGKETTLPAGMDLIFDNNLACPFDFESYYQSDLDGDGYIEGDYTLF